jgi:hypothetical protein
MPRSAKGVKYIIPCEITLRFEDLPSEKIAIPYEKLDDLIGGLEQIRRALNSFG